jgi:hypothetical protein
MRIRRLVPIAIATVALAGIGWLGTQKAAADPIVPPVLKQAVFLVTGGPYIGPSAAAEVSARAAKGPIARQEVSFHRYGDLLPWLHSSGVSSIDRQREVYLVVNSTPTANARPPGLLTGRDTCNWYAQIVDATTSTMYSYICGEGIWPASLPANFVNIKP